MDDNIIPQDNSQWFINGLLNFAFISLPLKSSIIFCCITLFFIVMPEKIKFKLKLLLMIVEVCMTGYLLRK